jgi:hypothetical protein
MIVVALLLTAGVFVGIVGLVVKLSGRRFPGDITGPKGNEIDYDNPYVGWNMFAKRPPEPTVPDRPTARNAPASPQPDSAAGEIADDFALWEAEHWPRQDRPHQ